MPLDQLPVRLPEDLTVTAEGNALLDRPDFLELRMPVLRRARAARDGHARLPLRRRLPAVPAPGPDGRPRAIAADPPRAAALGPGARLHQRRRHGQLRARPADDHEDAARPRLLHLAAGRRVLRDDLHARDGAARRAQDEQAPRQHGHAAGDRRARRSRRAAFRDAVRGRAREGVHLGRQPAHLLALVPAAAVDVRRAAPERGGGRARRDRCVRRPAPAPRGLVRHGAHEGHRELPAPRHAPGDPQRDLAVRAHPGLRGARRHGSRARRRGPRGDRLTRSACWSRLLAPVAPHMAEELWARSGSQGFVADAAWPLPAPTPV